MAQFLSEFYRQRFLNLARWIFLWTRLLLAGILLAGLFASAWSIQPAHAATITVTTTEDEYNNDGDCSLREAVIAANSNHTVDACPAGSGADTILLPAGNYVFSLGGMGEDFGVAGDLDIRGDLTLAGDGPLVTTIDASSLDRAFELFSGTFTLQRLSIRGGFAGGDHGSAIYNLAGSLMLDHVRLTANSGPEAVLVFTSLTVNSSRIQNTSDGTGLNVLRGATGLIQNSTISGNMDRGIETAADSLVLVNSTISGNSTPGSGAGINIYGGVTSLYNVTISNNSANSDLVGSDEGGGVYVFSSTLTARNTIIAGNFDLSPSGLDTPDCYIHPTGSFDSQGYNLIQDVTGCPYTGTTTGNLIGLNPLLGPLHNNGGPSFTHALLAGSPAIDAGGPAGVCRDQNNDPLYIDQRGYLRPIDGDGVSGAQCDIGAYEYNSTTTPTPTITLYPSNTPRPATTTPMETVLPGTLTYTATTSPTATATLAGGDITPTPTPPSGENKLYLPLIYP